MWAAYETSRDYLDDVVALVEKMLERAELERSAIPTHERRLGELEIELVQREEQIVARCEATAAAGDVLPLERLRLAFGLSATEIRVVSVLAALELAPNSSITSTATIGLIESLVYRTRRSRDASATELAEDAPLFIYALAEIGDPQVAWRARPIRVARRVLELALGRVRLDVEVSRFASLVEHPADGASLRLPAQHRATVYDAIAHYGTDALGAEPAIPLLIGPPGSGRCALASAAARACERPALVVRCEALPKTAPELARALAAAMREARLFEAVLVVRTFEVLSGDTDRPTTELVTLAASRLATHDGPVAITATRQVWPAATARSVVVVELGIPSQSDRAEIWARALSDRNLAEQAAARYRLTPGAIERAASDARQIAGARGTSIEVADIRTAVRTQLDAELATLGRRVEWQQTWEDLVLPADVCDELVELVSRVRNRRRVLDEWGFGRKVAKGVGVSALFSGPPGTGKTMVAGLIAQELELDLYLIDVSRMVSKWVGETEKNLARLFDAAAAGHAVLLFDEADSLFGKRTEVRSSNDRYANLEVNYLLQRMEEFDGITILTTNLETAVDEAFKRRLAFRIRFPLPELPERMRLWRAMLPDEAEIAGAIDFRALAERFEMSGGYIRNAVLRAAYLAAADGRAITMQHLQRAAAQEYAAMGKILHSSL